MTPMTTTSNGIGSHGITLPTAAATADPHAWLEDILGKKQLAWVEARNSDCLSSLGEPAETETYRRILSMLDSKEKIPSAYRIGIGPDAPYYNLWRDDAHAQGIWRKTSRESFLSKDPEWTTVIDLDALSPPVEGTAKTWVWHGSSLLDEGPDRSHWDRALISLSPGGSDADIFREFDLAKMDWVDPSSGGPDAGFAMTEAAKTRAAYRSRNELIIGTDFGGDGSTMTDSGYPRVVKSWKRGTPLEDAVTVFEGEKTDLLVSQYAYHDRGYVHKFQVRMITFYTRKHFYRKLSADQLATTTADTESEVFRPVPIPDDAELGTFANFAMVTLRSDLVETSGTFAAGSLIVLPMSDLLEGDWSNAVQMFEPSVSLSLSSTTETRDYIILKTLEDVRTGLVFWRYNVDTGSWTRQESNTGGEGGVPVGEDISVESHCRDPSSDNLLWLQRDGYLVPNTLEAATAEDCCLNTKRVKSKPAMFNSDGLMAEQRFAVSADGTRIPHFIIRRKNLKMDGSNPTLVDAYGGFEQSMLPGYSGGVGAGWLERGGVYVVANIRGGGEYGPRWHQAALREKRQRCFEDVEAVAQALIESGLTSPPKLACMGGSNGGLMVGNILTRPVASSLFGAAVCQVPLLDMKRYSHLLAGASWMAEYGDPDKAEEWEYLRKFSPYQMLRHDILGKPEEGVDKENGGLSEDRASWTCPKALFITSTRDDRVHPGHARKMVAALLDEAGTDQAPVVHYWENTEGGHGGAADNKQRASMWALTYTFLAQALEL